MQFHFFYYPTNVKNTYLYFWRSISTLWIFFIYQKYVLLYNFLSKNSMMSHQSLFTSFDFLQLYCINYIKNEKCEFKFHIRNLDKYCPIYKKYIILNNTKLFGNELKSKSTQILIRNSADLTLILKINSNIPNRQYHIHHIIQIWT